MPNDVASPGGNRSTMTTPAALALQEGRAADSDDARPDDERSRGPVIAGCPGRGSGGGDRKTCKAAQIRTGCSGAPGNDDANGRGGDRGRVPAGSQLHYCATQTLKRSVSPSRSSAQNSVSLLNQFTVFWGAVGRCGKDVRVDVRVRTLAQRSVGDVIRLVAHALGARGDRR